MPAKIEILSVDLLDEHRLLVNDLRSLASSLGLEFGWHYLLDLTWIISQLPFDSVKPPSLHILDAGAGVGVMQWYLAERGAQVISVDRVERADLSLRFRGRYQVRGMRPQDLNPALKSIYRGITNQKTPATAIKNILSELAYGIFAVGQQEVAYRKSLLSSLQISEFKKKNSEIGQKVASTGSRGVRPCAPTHGSVTIYHQDLRTLSDVADNSLDAVVAVSALEHNLPENLVSVVSELMRTLRPGGKILATLGAARAQDWFHEPSKGWCYTADSLRKLFDLPAGTPDNYIHYDEMLAALRNCAELRDNLAGFYLQSGDNGMPWGKWDPQYQVVGVCKVKE